MNTLRIAQGFALIVGLLDFLTGVSLLFQPALTLQLMHAAPMAGEALVFLRWIGAFVAAVGASYGWALARGGVWRLRGVFEFTALCRGFVGVFTAWSIIHGWLDWAWLSVPVTDLALAAGQVWLLKKINAEYGPATLA